MKGKDGVELSEVRSDKEIILDFPNFKLSPKSLFFPQCEVIGISDGDILRDVSLSDEKHVIFGIRPCDALALLYLDRVFCEGDFKDPYYIRKRQNAIIITLACNDPFDTCFCTSFGGSPSGKEGADVIVFDIEKKLIFEACTDKGESLLNTYSTHFRKPENAELRARDAHISLVEKKVKSINVTTIKEKLSECFDSPIWESIAQTCLGCGICTYLCPTCHCFALHDEEVVTEKKRLRIWDSCQFPSFTLEASGHNPRPSNSERMRQRVMHKFNYFVRNYNETACVGCGRCVSNCPVNIDIREILTTIASDGNQN